MLSDVVEYIGWSARFTSDEIRFLQCDCIVLKRIFKSELLLIQGLSKVRDMDLRLLVAIKPFEHTLKQVAEASLPEHSIRSEANF